MVIFYYKVLSENERTMENSRQTLHLSKGRMLLTQRELFAVKPPFPSTLFHPHTKKQPFHRQCAFFNLTSQLTYSVQTKAALLRISKIEICGCKCSQHCCCEFIFASGTSAQLRIAQVSGLLLSGNLRRGTHCTCTCAIGKIYRADLRARIISLIYISISAGWKLRVVKTPDGIHTHIYSFLQLRSSHISTAKKRKTTRRRDEEVIGDRKGENSSISFRWLVSAVNLLSAHASCC